MSGDVWVKKLIDRLVMMHRRGDSARDIAMALGHGITRNGVLGKIHRLRQAGKLEAPLKDTNEKDARARTGMDTKARSLNSRQHKASHGHASDPPQEPKPPRPLTMTEYDAIDPSTPGLLRIMDLKAHHCRWPLNNALGGEYYFCGDKKVSSTKPYCEKHAAVAYQKPAKSKEENANAN